MTYDCIIIGAGPAGVAAAVHMKRTGLNIVLIEKKNIGGLLRNANLIENYLGFPEGISGKRFAGCLRRHLQRLRIP